MKTGFKANTIEAKIKNIGLNKNNSLTDYIKYRTLFNQGKRTFKDNVKVFFMDIKIKLWSYISNANISYQKEDNYTAKQIRKQLSI